MYHFKLFLVVLVVLVIMDMIWLGFIARNMYFKEYASLIRLEGGKLVPVLWASALVYLLIACALTVFVLPHTHGHLLNALLYGAIMGAVLYGVYDFTCVAVFKSWPVAISIIDWFWGIFLCAFSSLVAAYCSRFL